MAGICIQINASRLLSVHLFVGRPACCATRAAGKLLSLRSACAFVVACVGVEASGGIASQDSKPEIELELESEPKAAQQQLSSRLDQGGDCVMTVCVCGRVTQSFAALQAATKLAIACEQARRRFQVNQRNIRLAGAEAVVVDGELRHQSFVVVSFESNSRLGVSGKLELESIAWSRAAVLARTRARCMRTIT